LPGGDTGRVDVVWHFSEDPDIVEFSPRTGAPGAPDQALVWAMDAEHAAAYWFPRQCPRVTFWPGTQPPTPVGEALLGGATGRRVHAIEWAWLDRVRSTALYQYVLDGADFEPWPPASGHRVARRTVRPLRVEPVGDLLERHAAAGIELRLLPELWALVDAVVAAGLEFSVIRARNAAPREGAAPSI
jgi:hypothetical protein